MNVEMHWLRVQSAEALVNFKNIFKKIIFQSNAKN